MGLLDERTNGFEDHCEAQCDDLDLYFADVATESEIDLNGVTSLMCPDNADGEVISEVFVESGKTLTIKSLDTVRYHTYINNNEDVAPEACARGPLPIR